MKLWEKMADEFFGRETIFIEAACRRAAERLRLINLLEQIYLELKRKNK